MSTPVVRTSRLGQAQCLECGAIRSAKARYLGRGNRALRCPSCGRVTTHAAVNWDGEDPREQANHSQPVVHPDTEVLNELDALMRLMRTCNIDVLIDESDVTSPEAEPQGGLVDIVRWLEPEGYLVRVQRNLSLADRVHCLDWAWRSMRPTIARWERCAIETDLDGQQFQRIYNNELETGVFERS
ncbi:MAG: hypothetical protein ABWX96_08955 [Propionibacteriaceae bacterium]